MLEAKAETEAEDNSSKPSLRPRTKFWNRGQLVLEDLTSLAKTRGTGLPQGENFMFLSSTVFV